MPGPPHGAALAPVLACPTLHVNTRGLHACLFCVGNILGSGLLKDRLDAVPLSTMVCMDGHEQVALLEFPLVPLGLIFWNTKANQGSCDTSQRRSGRGPAEHRHDRPSSAEWPQAWNGYCPNPYQPAQGASQNA